MKGRFTEEQIVSFLREADTGLPLKEQVSRQAPSWMVAGRTAIYLTRTSAKASANSA